RRRSGRRSVINAIADDSENSGDVEVDNIKDRLARNLLKYKTAIPSSRPSPEDDSVEGNDGKC
ncbi:hypothetical protein HHI36_024030, partial [Cryptolaemus montrouzieri]